MRDVFAIDSPPVISDNVALVISQLGVSAEVFGALEIPRQRARQAM
jgi:hypothetical protein